MIDIKQHVLALKFKVEVKLLEKNYTAAVWKTCALMKTCYFL